jgi:hypothetical protein
MLPFLGRSLGPKRARSHRDTVSSQQVTMVSASTGRRDGIITETKTGAAVAGLRGGGPNSTAGLLECIC